MRLYRKWFKKVIEADKRITGDINIIFTSRNKMLHINKQYLKHNYHTDVITFEFNDGMVISGDIFIGVETVMENSKKLDEAFNTELSRVMIHGILHLLGMEDHGEKGKRSMRKNENKALKILDSIRNEGKV
ncbi:MAG: rRNA maturation RNase YbeY [Bacteroidales bacterium]|nr:rRNA maturation RNase YbeY [Bacteroidales bacterium]